MAVGGPGQTLRSLRRDQTVQEAHVAPGTARRMFGLLRPYRSLIAVFLAVVVADSAISAANPLIYRQIINEGIGGRRLDLVIGLALVVAGLAVADAALSLSMRYLSSRVGQGLVYDMRTRVFAHVQRMPLAFFTRTQTGALVSRLNSDVQGAQEALSDVMSSVVGNLISISLVLAAMLVLSWQLTLVSLLLVPLFMVPARWVGRKLQGITREGYELSAEMNSTMIERFNVAGALLVKLFGRPADEDKAFAHRAERVRDISITKNLYARVFYVALVLTASLATALVYGWGGAMAVRGVLDVGTLVALTAYLNRLYGPLTALSNVRVDVMTALVSFERIFEVLDLPSMVTEKPDAVTIPRGPARLAFEHVDFAYPSGEEVSLASLESVATLDSRAPKGVLFDINFVAEPGQLVALVGPSGGGKTTISQLVARLYDVRSGAVRVNDVDVRDATFASLRDIVGVVSQDAHLFHDTIRANLAYADPGATEEQMREALRGAQILPLVESLPDGLDTPVGERGYRLSGGEKQRIAIARLLLKSPDIVVLDEATAHLDSESELAVQRALDLALAGRTSLVIAHRLSTVRDADQILVVDAGRIVERGRHEDLLASHGLYAELYRTQFEHHDRGPEADTPGC